MSKGKKHRQYHGAYSQFGASDMTSAEVAIRDFLALCQRPLGTLNFSAPNTPEVSRAILRLADSINENL